MYMTGNNIIMAICKMIQLIVVLLYFVQICYSGESFDHDIEYEHDSGDVFLLKSKGKFADIIDLDDVQCIKRLLCRHNLLMIALKDETSTLDWEAGQILLGSAKWKCFNTGHTPRGSGIYTRIKQIIKPRDGRVDIVTEPVGPFDLLEEANIHLQYKKYDGLSKPQNRKEQRSERKRRYSSNLLSNMLNHINWTSSLDLSVPNNYNLTSGQVQRTFMLERFYGMSDLIYWDSNDTSTGQSRDDFTKMMLPMWNLDCPQCFGLTNFSYIFELVIYKVNNKPVIKKYLSQIEAVSHVHYESKMHFYRESALKGSRLLWATPETEMFRVPLAVAQGVPPVELVVTTNDVVIAQIHGYVAGETEIDIAFDTSGKFSLSQNFASNHSAKGEASYQEWKLNHKSFDVNAPSKINLTTSIMQTIVFNASIHWSGKDVSAILSPPAVMTVKPEIAVQTNFKEFSREYNCTLKVIADLQMSRARFVVEAFGLHIWNVLLAEGFDHKLLFFNTTIGEILLFNCPAFTSNINMPRSMEEVCGPTKDPIPNTLRDSRLKKLVGDQIYSQKDDNSTVPCGGSASNDQCYVSANLAFALVRLLRFIEQEMTDRNLVIIRGYESPTSKPDGDASLFSEGRAAEISLTDHVTGKRTTDQNVVRRLSQLSVCSGIKYVNHDETRNLVVVAVPGNSDAQENCADDNDRCHFLQALSIADTNAEVIRRYNNLPQELKKGETYPASRTVLDVCGAPLYPMSRFSLNVHERLYYYNDTDVEFKDTDTGRGRWCGHPVRLCGGCTDHVTSMWNKCSVRLMAPRTALFLKRLKTLVKKESGLSKIIVLKAFEEQTEIPVHNQSKENLLFRDGRGLVLNVHGGMSLGRLASLAVKSGFDFVKYSHEQNVHVFVKDQENFMSRIAFFPSGAIMQGVLASNMLDGVEYMLLKAHKNEPRIPLLLDGYDTTIKLSPFYTVQDFVAPNFRFFRLDETLLQCLDLVSDDLGQQVEVIPGSGYRVRSLNLNNIDLRNKNERFRFQLGQAVEIRLRGNRTVSSLVELGKAVMRVCPYVTRPQHRALGLGCHGDRLYVDVHPIPLGEEDKYIKVWNSGNQILYLELMSRAFSSLMGGPIISPLVRKSACATPLGKDFTHLSFQMKLPAVCINANQDNFCSSTESHRREEAQKLQVRMSSAAGADNLPRREILPEIEACIVKPCGGCVASGPTWDRKVRACAKMVKKYIDRASRAFQKLDNKVTFFNTENSNSTVHSLACHFDFICVENVQLYSLLMPLITATYSPHRGHSVEEKLFAVENNPSPLLEIVSQELAYRAVGTVRVFVDNNRDIMVLRNVLKVVMAYNKNVTKVEFHLAENVKPEDVQASIQRKLESWSSACCPDWSRFAVVPYTVHQIPNHRWKRSIEFSVPRNHARLSMNYKEFDWLRKL